MLTRLIDEDLLRNVIREPENHHWSQSPLEKVSDASVLVNGGDFALVRTRFSASRLIRHATWRTEIIGATYRELFRLHNKIGSYNTFVRWFYEIMLPESYEQGDFEHLDYTLWTYNQKNKIFVNLRQFPEGSYLLDLIDAEFSAHLTSMGGGVSSYTGGAEHNDALKPEQRTKTLEQLATQNRARMIVIQTDEGNFEAQFEDGPMTFVNYHDFSTLSFFDIGRDAMDNISRAFLSEKALQRILTRFRYLLEECGIHYRK